MNSLSLKSKSQNTLPTSFRPPPIANSKPENTQVQPVPSDSDLTEANRTYSYPLPDMEPFCVWLGNLPAEAKPSDIVEYLEPLKIEPRDIRFGRIHKNKYTCAYIDFYNKEDMKRTLRSIDCSDAPLFMGRQVEIDINEGIVVDREHAVNMTGSSTSDTSLVNSSDVAVVSKQDVRYNNKKKNGGSKQQYNGGNKYEEI